MSAEKRNHYFVHGAWADGSCWHNVILPLHWQGLDVICAPIPLTSLSDDIAALSRTIERTSGPVVLVGHAYAGAVIAGPTDERIKALVYIAALAPATVKRWRKFSIARSRIRRPSFGTRPARFHLDDGRGLS